jgi:hypothetical protein
VPSAPSGVRSLIMSDLRDRLQTVAALAMGSLVGHLVYGAVLGVLYAVAAGDELSSTPSPAVR